MSAAPTMELPRPFLLGDDDLGPLPLPRDLIGLLRDAGLRGRGGAAFPTADKLAAVAGQRGRPIVVANAVEGEPASAKDRALARLSPHLVLDGAVASAAALGTRDVVVAVSDAALDERRALERAAAQRRERVDIEVAAVPHGFVSGEETAVLNALGGGPPKPTLKPPYPFERGLDGRPTLVQNAETLAHIALICRFGAEWFRREGTTLVTLRGAFRQPGVHEVERGGTLGDLVRKLGGTSRPVSAFLVGGYFGRWVTPAKARELRLTPDVLAAGAIVVLPAGVCAFAECARVLAYLAEESAGQCGPCVHGLRAIADTMSAPGEPDRRRRLEQLAALVDRRGACRHPDGAAGFLRSALDAFADEFAAHVRRGRCGARDARVLPIVGRRQR